MRTRAIRCFGKVLLRLSLILALAAEAFPATASNTLGAWSPVQSWPLIAVHAVLMPDGRVLSYGTTSSGQQTGIFIYDVWDPSAEPEAEHLTFPNTIGTDIFCSSKVVLPQGGQVFIAGGDNWTGASTTNTGNNNSNLFDYYYGNETLTRYNNMNRPRWYSSSIALLNGEIDLYPGRLRRHGLSRNPPITRPSTTSPAILRSPGISATRLRWSSTTTRALQSPSCTGKSQVRRRSP